MKLWLGLITVLCFGTELDLVLHWLGKIIFFFFLFVLGHLELSLVMVRFTPSPSDQRRRAWRRNGRRYTIDRREAAISKSCDVSSAASSGQHHWNPYPKQHAARSTSNPGSVPPPLRNICHQKSRGITGWRNVLGNVLFTFFFARGADGADSVPALENIGMITGGIFLHL